MSDLVERLRRQAPNYGVNSSTYIVRLEAATEIERLRAIENAAKDLLRAVDRTENHTEWFKAIGAIALAVNKQPPSTGSK